MSNKEQDTREAKQSTTTVGPKGHGFDVGDRIDIGRPSLWALLKRPRVRYVSDCPSITTLMIVERRMTWAEWRAAVWQAIRGGRHDG